VVVVVVVWWWFGGGGGGLVVVVVEMVVKTPKNLAMTGFLAPPTPKKMWFPYVGRRRHTIPSSNYYYYLIKINTFVTH
jgi:hypothetical protein